MKISPFHCGPAPYILFSFFLNSQMHVAGFSTWDKEDFFSPGLGIEPGTKMYFTSVHAPSPRRNVLSKLPDKRKRLSRKYPAADEYILVFTVFHLKHCLCSQGEAADWYLMGAFEQRWLQPAAQGHDHKLQNSSCRPQASEEQPRSPHSCRRTEVPQWTIQTLAQRSQGPEALETCRATSGTAWVILVPFWIFFKLPWKCRVTVYHGKFWNWLSGSCYRAVYAFRVGLKGSFKYLWMEIRSYPNIHFLRCNSLVANVSRQMVA